MDSETGEVNELRLEHREEAEKFYQELAGQGMKVRVGMEASGQARWFEGLLAELQFELWMGDAAEIGTKRVRKQKTDRQDAPLLLRLLLEDRFPRIWVPSWENRDLRQLLWHRHRMVQRRTRLMNQWQAVALNEGLRRKKGLWGEAGRKQLESFRLASWASRRRRDRLEWLDRLNPTMAELSQAVEPGSGEVPRGARFADASRGGFSDRAGFRVDRRRGGAVPVRPADGELSGTGAVGGVQRRSAPAGTHHQTGQLAVTLPAGGGSASHGAQ